MALPLSLGWHPVPTLGSLADAVAVFCVAALLAMAPPLAALDGRRLLSGTGGLIGLLLLSCVLQPLRAHAGYAGFWIGPLVVLVTAFLVCCDWQRRADEGLKVVAAAVLLAALINALVGFLQYWRIADILDFFGPYLVYWDHSDPVAHGNVAQRNILASLCLLGMAASVYLFPQRATPAIALVGFLAYVVALTASRTPLVMVLVVLLVALIRERRWRALGQPFVRWFVVPVLLAQVLAPLVNRLLFSVLDVTLVDSSVARLSAEGLGIRPVFYGLAAKIGLQAWAWGLGWKSLPAAMVEQGYREQLWGLDELPTHAHNVLLHLWAENGIFIALLASFYPIWLVLRQAATGSRENYARLSLLVLIVHSWLEYPLWQPALLFLFVALMCTLEHQEDCVLNQPGLFTRLLVRGVAIAVAIGASVTALQFGLVAYSWKSMPGGVVALAPTRLAALKLNPVIEPYADWLELNMQTDTPAQRVLRLERLVTWLPDSMMLGLLADTYRSQGRSVDAQRMEARRRLVFGVTPAQ